MLMLKMEKKKSRQWDFFTIEEDLPTGSDIVLDFTLGIDEIFEVKAYPKTNKAKSKKIVLARGNKDSKTLDFLSNSLEKVQNGKYSKKGIRVVLQFNQKANTKN